MLKTPAVKMVPILLQNVFGTALIFLAMMNFCNAQCPDLGDVFQCECDLFGTDAFVECTHTSSHDQLLNLASKLKGHEIEDLTFHESSFSLSPPDVFKGTEIRQLWFSDCDLQNSGETVEASVEELHFVNTNLIENGNLKLNLSLVKNLDTLDVEENKIPKLTQIIASGIPEGLKALLFTDCAIEEIEEDFFKTLQNLTYLELPKNKLKKIPEKLTTFPPLEWLDLGSNEIEQLPKNFMSTFPKLGALYLNDNKISTLPEDTWKNIFDKVFTLALPGNPLICDNDIKWTVDAEKPRIYDGQCFEPERLKDKELIELKLEDFQ